jgi:hypothetical protein
VTNQLLLSIWQIRTVVMLAAVAVTAMVVQFVVMAVLLLQAIVMMIRYMRSPSAQQTQVTTKSASDDSSALTVATPSPVGDTINHVDVFDVSGKAQWLPIEADLVTTASYAVVRNSHLPVNITIADSITVESMQSIMRHTNINHLHLQLGNVTPDVMKALSDMANQKLLANKCLSRCTIDNFERLDAATATALLQNMPDSLHSLNIKQAQPHRYDVRQFGTVVCPRSVKTLSITHVGFVMVLPEGLEKLYTVDCNARAWKTIPSTLTELHATNVRNKLPALPDGLLTLQMHTLNRTMMNIPLENIPRSVTHLKLSETQTIRVPVWPPHLQVLDVGANYLHRLDDLPDTITELHIKLNRKVVPRYQLETLPPQLKVLDIRRLEFSPGFVLPETLQVLRQDIFRKQHYQMV